MATILLILLFFVFPSVADDFELAFNFGFEMFIKYFDSGALESESTNIMKDMYIWPTTFKTYFIGDGFYSDPFNSGFYYMGTDIGFLRLIYYFGVLGLLIYFILQLQVIYFSFLKNNKFYLTFVALVLYCIILNFKGFSDLIFLAILFCFNQNLSIEKNCQK